MAVFGTKPWARPFRKMSIFRLFELLVFISQKGIFLFQNIIKKHFAGLYCLKKKVGNLPFLNHNHEVTPFQKSQFFSFLIFLFLKATSAYFLFQNIIRDISLAYIDKKKNFEKWLLLDQINGLTPLEKCQFSTVWTSSFHSLERRFFVLEYHERHFPGLYCLKKKNLEKQPFLEQNHGLNSLGKCQFFDFLIFLFLQPRKGFFRSRIR